MRGDDGTKESALHSLPANGGLTLVTPPAGPFASPQSVRETAQAWRTLREAGDIQYAPVPPLRPPETPDWLRRIGEWIHDMLLPIGRALGMSWPTIQTVLIALAALLALVVLWVLLRPLVARLRNRRASDADEEWTPDRAAAAALLAKAERLAQKGRYDEAVHLLLQRSVQQIGDARPDWLLPASTAREIAAFPMLPERARRAFGAIATRVERSLFALRDLDAADWTAARSAYADFALAELSA